MLNKNLKGLVQLSEINDVKHGPSNIQGWTM